MPLAVDIPVLAPCDPPPRFRTVVLETEIAAVLEARSALGETIDAAFRRKESELRELFARLSLVEALGLHDRLANPQPGDQLASQFTLLLMADRRARLISFLADARRRDAIGSVRRK